MVRRLSTLFSPALLFAAATLHAQTPAAGAPGPGGENPRVHEIVRAVDPARIESDVRRLVSFGTRHTLSDTVSPTRGIGAARRWIFSEFERISRECGGCLEVMYVGEIVPGSAQGRIPVDTRVVNVVAIQRGQTDPGRYVLIQGHYDSRVNDVMNATADAPGANDDASGTSAAIEAARVLSKHRFDATIVYAALAGEEQGLNGGNILARYAQQNGWRIAGVLNNDIVGNTRGIGGQAGNTQMRVFAPGIPPEAPAAELRRYLYSGGELDVPSRQLARYVDRTADRYVPDLDAQVIYRLDRFGRGGDHTPFFLAGYPAVRLTEMYEDYTRQHQDLRVEDGIHYGDVPEMVDYRYTGRITALNAATLAQLAWAPAAPDSVTIRGALSASTTLRWQAVSAPDLAGYRVYWRDATSPTWDHSRWVGNVTEVTLDDVIIDNWFFGVAAVDRDGNESLVVFPAPGR
ncbi:MAG TPA: M28 family metallopeptidase [Longimicrobium sp.]|nr:M28 family metallopeptidase [Longimicrobium sp.]